MSSTVLEQPKLAESVKTSSPKGLSVQTSAATWKAFSELARVEKPAGVLAFHVPLLLGSLVSVVTERPQPSYLDGTVFFFQLLFNSFVLRSAACAWNDAADWKFDSQVARSRTRPIPRGSVTPDAARAFAALLASLWVFTVWQANPGALGTVTPNFLFNLAYPFAKRFTNYPQVFLGVNFSWNILTGYAMTAQHDLKAALQEPHIQQSLGWLALANVAWTVFYDMIYAYQDLKDDEKAGVGSIALQWKAYGKVALAVLASIQIGSLVAAGYAISAGLGYFGWSCAGSALVSAVALARLDLRKPQSCALWFRRNLLYGGITMCSGFAVEYAQRL